MHTFGFWIDLDCLNGPQLTALDWIKLGVDGSHHPEGQIVHVIGATGEDDP